MRYRLAQCICIIGVNPGYNNTDNDDFDMCSFMQEFLNKESEKYGDYIAFVIVPSKTIYKEEWGCPSGGELTYMLYATMSSRYIGGISDWKEQCVNIIQDLKEELHQSTVTITFSECDVVYLES